MNNYQIENFKSIKKNDSYGLKGSVGKSFSERSFGGKMSNRKFTKNNVMQHKPTRPENITNKIKKNVIPPLFPLSLDSLPSSSKTYRTGFVNTKNYIKQPELISDYYEPAQQLEDINFKSGIHINNIINDKNIQDTSIGNRNNDGWDNNYNNGWNNNGWNWLNGPYNPFSYFNPYASYMMPQDSINNTETIQQQHPSYNNTFIIVIIILLLIIIFKK